jgi:hypothetical protein
MGMLGESGEEGRALCSGEGGATEQDVDANEEVIGGWKNKRTWRWKWESSALKREQ